MFARKGEMGIGTLIIFIALLLVAAIAAGVLIQTSSSLQEKALSTGDEAQGQIATNARVIEVSATDGQQGVLRNFTQIMKLAPGSEAIKLEEALLTINTFDRSATLSYAGTDASLLNAFDGFYTVAPRNYSGGPWSSDTIPTDLDMDDAAETLNGGANGNNVNLTISNGTNPYTLELGNCSTPEAISPKEYVGYTRVYCDGNNATTAYIEPDKNAGSGQFSVEYLQKGNNWVDGNLQRGDVIKVYYEAPKNIGEDQFVRINFIPKIGTPTLTEFTTPEVISEERMYLYP